MKQLNEVLKQTPIYLHDWKDDEKIQVIIDFEEICLTKKEFESTECPFQNKKYWEENKQKLKEKLKEWDTINILFASYGSDNYSGDAFVLFEKDGKLYEVNAGHCSCYGLEEQFNPEETTLESLHQRLIDGKMGKDDYAGNEFADELKEFLGI